MAVAAARNNVQNLLEIGLLLLYLFGFESFSCCFIFQNEHLGQKATKEENLSVPVFDDLKVAFDTLYDNMQQELVVVGQESGCLSWFHVKGMA